MCTLLLKKECTGKLCTEQANNQYSSSKVTLLGNLFPLLAISSHQARNKLKRSSIKGFTNSNSCATGAPLPMKKWYTSLEEDNARDRFDASATSLSNSMIRMPLKHHCLSLADIGEARMGEFDPRLASPCLSS